MIKKSILFALLAAVVLIIACDNKYPGFSKTETGLYYKFYIQDEDGIKPAEGDILTVNMVYRTGDSILFNSRDLEEPFRFPLDPPSFSGDIFEGLAMMAVGDSATFIVSADSLKRFGSLQDLPEGTMLYFDIRLLEITSAADFAIQQQEMAQKLEQELIALREKEKQDLADYITANGIRVKPTASGMYFIQLRAGNGKKPESGKVVELHYSAHFLDGNKLFDTHDEGETVFFELGKQFEILGVEEALEKMRAGGKARIIVPSALAYGEKGISEMVPPCTPVIFELELLRVLDKKDYAAEMEQKEQKLISDFIAKNYPSAHADVSGIYYIETRKGTGVQAVSGKTVRVHYTGKFLDGRIFDTSVKSGNPIQFRMGAAEVIPGWEIGIAKMNAGGTAVLIIPSALAFGDVYTGIIPPFTPLMYEVELLGVK